MFRTGLMAAAALALAAAPVAAQSADPERDIVETAVAAGSFTTLAAALEAAGLVETLKGEGPFTVFAPTDEAFAALPAGAVDGLLADRKALTAVLTYHVVPGRVMAADLAGLADEDGYITVKTVNGAELRLHVASSAVHVGKGMANVVTADVSASNGVIHVIDAVLMP